MTVKYTEDHEWVSVEGDTAIVGITSYAAEQLGDVVFVELPEEGRNSNKGDELAVVESVKAASDVYAPVSGIVKEANSELEGAPETVNQDPEGKGWFVKMLITDPTQLDAMMDADAYKAFCADL
ncbi:glycine cleavage system protein GcvH [Ponticaulis sp.]|uniref:glycine cleavage system protein GcvH n=1 Tax=Ponticaulis sp. TaxID=2020902 RepID=UPI000B68EF8A|nr:glycine cleavage system protein GcvH [Ponticaulis sp.]MAJ08769.1 glycine cleavage system protein H [Ponticaulis sp.]RPG17466.1 MAG: glycine cleavage system protein GcvH [Hyphomonadaceae bacterium TMED125]HBH88455.1 glycine cleavage system protein GcvH [Hyphomonadaceae bacterium]HBJ93946.1 glycine cleavage system protein GcvH [Hyphomonadaceae bacterium]|tara:strand:+ start:29441 stop:29812 length:372 start_codon:yes stop_codon:yes gene_type:complete